MCAQSQPPTSIFILKGRTLLELLRFHAESYVGMSKLLHDFSLCLSTEEAQSNSVSGEDLLTARQYLEMAKAGCEEIGLQVCTKHAEELLRSVDSGLITSPQIGALLQNIERELSCHFFVGIPPERVKLFTESRLGWEQVIARFPRTVDDVEEMNKCFSLSRYQAAVFHSLMVMEHGLVELGQKIGATDHREGWDASCKKLAEIVGAGYKANTTDLDYAFLEQLNTCVQAIKLAWRNKVNHATGKPNVISGGFACDVAEEIISATRGFMRRLAERL
jgi:hypothetical protein